MLHDVVSVEPAGDRRLRVRFDDGVNGVIDVAQMVQFTGVFEPLREARFFAQGRAERRRDGGGAVGGACSSGRFEIWRTSRRPCSGRGRAARSRGWCIDSAPPMLSVLAVSEPLGGLETDAARAAHGQVKLNSAIYQRRRILLRTA